MAAVADGFGDHRGGPWKQRADHQQQQVRADQAGVDSMDAGEQIVVADPDRRDVQERREIGDIRRPLPQQFVEELSALAARTVQVEYEQGDGDGKDAVAERFDASAFREPSRRRGQVVIKVGHLGSLTSVQPPVVDRGLERVDSHPGRKSSPDVPFDHDGRWQRTTAPGNSMFRPVRVASVET